MQICSFSNCHVKSYAVNLKLLHCTNLRETLTLYLNTMELINVVQKNDAVTIKT